MKSLNEMKKAVDSKEAQILTVELAKQLKGKSISTIYFGYKGQDGVDNFVVGEIKSHYDLAKEESYNQHDPRFATRADYWESYMSDAQLNEEKSTLMLLAQDGRETYIRAHSFNCGVFTCSDSDRFVYFVEDEN